MFAGKILVGAALGVQEGISEGDTLGTRLGLTVGFLLGFRVSRAASGSFFSVGIEVGRLDGGDEGLDCG